VLQEFPGHDACPATDAPGDWYAVDPQQTAKSLPGSSYAISPSARNPDGWAAAVAGMVGSREPWQLITSFNDAVAGTDVQPAPAWSSATTYGDYLDALHADGAPTIAAAGDIACDPASSGYNGGLGDADSCRQRKVSDVLVDQRLQRVLALGDNQYEDGQYSNFLLSYDPSWGRVKGFTSPAVGNHEYNSGPATGYFDYFNGQGQATGPAGARDKGYYSYDVGSWHVVVLNSNCSEIDAGKGCAAGGAQASWLSADLAAHPNACTLAYAHHPRYSSGEHGSTDTLQPLWQILADGGVDVYLAGHDHDYERFAPTDANGLLDRAEGIRSFVVGTGGKSWRSFDTVVEQSEHQGGYEAFGVLDLALEPTGYRWDFVRDSEFPGPPLDGGADRCH
jgi:hypothetical protein